MAKAKTASEKPSMREISWLRSRNRVASGVAAEGAAGACAACGAVWRWRRFPMADSNLATWPSVARSFWVNVGETMGADNPIRLLVADDHALIRRGLRDLIG